MRFGEPAPFEFAFKRTRIEGGIKENINEISRLAYQLLGEGSTDFTLDRVRFNDGMPARRSRDQVKRDSVVALIIDFQDNEATSSHPVSYTHLDVYKRQGRRGVRRQQLLLQEVVE